MRKFFHFGLTLSFATLFAIPESPTISAGTAEFITSSSNVLEVKVSDRAILDWNSFSVGKEELLKFIQPDSQASVLNRVVGSSMSELLGKIEANGQVFLLNPNGILVGREGSIDVNSFVVSTLDVANEQFLAFKNISFQGSSIGKIEILGSISAQGDVVLLSGSIENRGRIQASQTSHLGAGDRWDLEYQGDFLHPSAFKESQGTIFNSGIICGGKVSLQAREIGDVFAIRNEGVIETSQEGIAILAPNSSVYLDGRIATRGKPIAIEGGFIRFQDGAIIDSSHDFGGGSITILGSEIFVPSMTSLRADATELGDGGNIVLKATRWTAFHGNIYASGGPLGGNGGFAEVSGKENIDYRGLVFLPSVCGKKGTLLLDPTDIVIGVGGGSPSACNPCASGSCGAIPALCSTFTNGNLDSAMLQAQLQGGACDVIVDATGAGVGAGTITHNAGANVVWTSSNSLTYNAVGNISIFSNILNSTGAGNIFLRTQGGTVQISNYANVQSVSVGSQNGMTQVCAPNAALILESAGTATDRHAQIGFLVPEGVATTCSGPISISCSTLTLFTSDQSNTAAQIGHGQAGSPAIATQLITQASSTIDVVVAGNITLLNSPFPLGAGNQTACRIGHGMQTLGGASFLRGDVSVVSGGQIDLLTTTPRPVAVTVSNIGHGETNSGGTPYSVAGNIFVQAAGDINIRYVPPYLAAFNTLGIGSNGNGFTPSPAQAITGNITVIAGRDLNMVGPPAINAFNRMIIGWFGPGNVTRINSLIRVSACRDINLNVNNVQSDFFFIGASTAGNQFITNGDVIVAAGRNLNFTTTSLFAASGRGRIGNPANTGTSRTSVTAGGNISISGTRNVGIQGVGDISVSAGGDISLTSLGTAAAEFAYIGPNNGTAAVTTRVYAQGSIIATNSATARAIIGRAAGTAAYASSLDVRAGGNIQIASPYTLTGAFVLVPTTGSIFIEADTILPASSLWTALGGQITSISGQALVQPITVSSLCGASPIQSNSAAIAPNLFGGLSFNTGAFGGPVTLQTTATDIILHSAPNLVNGANTPTLTVGIGDNQLQVITTANIDLSGSICADGFNNIIIDSVANPWTTGGSILGRAANEIQINTPIITSGAGESITFVAGCDFNGGNLLLNGNIQTNNGPIFLSAGADPNCANSYLCSGGISSVIPSSVIQNNGTVSSGTATITIQAAQDITLNGSATSLITTSGAIQTRAGRNTSLSRIVTNSAPAGIIQMISGNNMTMEGATISSPNPVILVVDDNFPSAPLIGPGLFSMDAASAITGSSVLIYTALQGSNSILGSINATLFTPGTLYVDTALEQWMTYFSCGNPFVNLGLPFTIFYKDSLQEITQQAMIVIDEFLVDLHPYNQFPGWMERFIVGYKKGSEPSSFSSLNFLKEEPYYFRRRHLNVINHPKTYTQLNPSQ